MSLRLSTFSSVKYGPLVTFNLAASARPEGESSSRAPRNAAGAPARNLRRFRYTDLGVISEYRNDGAFLISILLLMVIRSPAGNRMVRATDARSPFPAIASVIGNHYTDA